MLVSHKVLNHFHAVLPREPRRGCSRFQSLPRTRSGVAKHVLSLSKGSRLKNNPHGSCGFGFLQWLLTPVYGIQNTLRARGRRRNEKKMLQNFAGLRKCSKRPKPMKTKIFSRQGAKTLSSEIFFPCAFASLREIFRFLRLRRSRARILRQFSREASC